MAPSRIDIDDGGADVDLQGVTDVTSVQIPIPLSIDSIAPARAKAAALSTAIAPFSSSDMFKSAHCFSQPKAKRWDHRISTESKARYPSKLKGAAQYLKDPNIISLGGGLPSSEYFPFERLDLTIPNPSNLSAEPTTHSIGKHDIKNGKSPFDMHIALNYGQSMGFPQLLRFITEHTELVHNPPYSDWECCVDVGSTSSLDMALRLFCQPGDCVLTEEYTFSSAVDTMVPMGLKVVGVRMDDQGMLASDLDHILSNWDTTTRNAPKPFLLYTVPTGQNPTGATQSLARRRELMAVATKHDLFIIEDEPYYFLQMAPYTPSSTDTSSSPSTPPQQPHNLSSDISTSAKHTHFIKSLVPSLLSLDTDGRVLRLDSFSKVLCPGSRTGWITGPAQIIERFIRHSEVSVQTASGFSQIILYKLLDEAWGHAGFFDWLMHLRAEYTQRRDVMLRACDTHLGHLKDRGLVSWTPPTAGMFHWITVNHKTQPQQPQQSPSSISDLESRLFHSFIAAGVLVGRGSWFRAEAGTDSSLHFRMTFAAAEAGRIEEAVRRFGIALEDEFRI